MSSQETIDSHVLFDHARASRIGLPEAVFCEGKSYDALLFLLSHFGRGNGHRPILFTRLSETVFRSMPGDIQEAYDFDPLSRTAFGGCLPMGKEGHVSIVSAGTADGFVAHEAARTLLYLGIRHDLFEDCGVAGLWRLTDRLEQINESDCVIVVAGLDAALASVLGGLTPKPVFAVPTSVGYGVADSGRTALGSMLVSCAPGIGVLNIDNGFGAACACARIINALRASS